MEKFSWCEIMHFVSKVELMRKDYTWDLLGLTKDEWKNKLSDKC